MRIKWDNLKYCLKFNLKILMICWKMRKLGFLRNKELIRRKWRRNIWIVYWLLSRMSALCSFRSKESPRKIIKLLSNYTKIKKKDKRTWRMQRKCMNRTPIITNSIKINNLNKRKIGYLWNYPFYRRSKRNPMPFLTVYLLSMIIKTSTCLNLKVRMKLSQLSFGS